MKLHSKSVLPIMFAAAIAAGLAAAPADPAAALMLASPQAKSIDFGPIPPRIQLPQGKEELSTFDIRHAVTTYLTRVGALDVKVGKIEKAGDIAIVQIVNGFDDPVGMFGVDVVTAEIFPQTQLETLLGRSNAADCSEPPSASLLAGKGEPESYRARLRRHMMSDGRAWAPWLSDASAAGCASDYKDGGPDIPLRKEIF